MNICALVISYYSWEMATNRYAKVQKSIAVHHWLSCVAAMTIIYLDRFSPLITWYAIVGLFSAGIPINVALFLRASAKDYYQMAAHIRRSLKVAAYWYLCHLITLFIDACVIITNQWLSGYYDGNAGRIVLFCFTILSMIAFLYNDIITLRALFQLSYQHYEVLSRKKDFDTRSPQHSNYKKEDNANRKSINRFEKSATRIHSAINGNARKLLKIGQKEFSQLTVNSNNPHLYTNNLDYNPDGYWYEAYPISGTRTEVTRQIHSGMTIDGNWVDDSAQTQNGLGQSMDLSANDETTEITKMRNNFHRAGTDTYADQLKLSGMYNVYMYNV